MSPALGSLPSPSPRHDAQGTPRVGWSSRPLVAADRDALAHLLRDGAPFGAEERAVALELIDAAVADLSRKPLDALRSGYEIIIAEQADAIVGYLCYGATPMTEGTFDLYWIVTDRAHRGLGIARGLVNDMERALRRREGRLVRVETSKLEAYGAARAFYAAIGYPVASVLPDFYRPGDDLITYLKAL